MKKYLTIVKKWHNPKIEIYLTDGIEFRMDIEDFRKILKEELCKVEFEFDGDVVKYLKEKLVKEIGSVTLIFKNKTFEQKLSIALENVLAELKANSLIRNEDKIILDKKLDACLDSIFKTIKYESVKVVT